MSEIYQTDIIPVDAAAPDSATLTRLGAALRAGELVAFPTETVYGLGADATNAAAVAKIFVAKARPTTDPLIVHIASLDDLPMVTGRADAVLPPLAQVLATQFWPGPLTLILPRGERIPLAVTAGQATMGVRLPAHPVARALIAAAGVPVAAPSANRFGHVSPTTAQHVMADLDGRIPWILDAGPCAIGVESTILDVTQPIPLLLRPGGTPVEAIEAAIGMSVQRREKQAVADSAAAPAPGMLLSHYAPRARLVVYEGDNPVAVWQHVISAIRAAVVQGQRVGALVPTEMLAPAQDAGASVGIDLGAQDDAATAAQRLFAGLRALDDAGVDLIISGAPSADGLGLALRDRLWRAAGGAVIAVPA